MRLAVVAVGRMKAGAERDLAERYRGRATDAAVRLGWSALDVSEIPEGRGSRTDERRAAEAGLLLGKAAGARTVVFDERGGSLGSEALAARLAGWRDAGQDIACLIGGPDGFDERVRGGAALLVSFGALTIPHQLVRVLVLEQLYRAMTILAGHPYHRGEPS